MDTVGDQVDRLTRRRARIATIVGYLFIVTQGTRSVGIQSAHYTPLVQWFLSIAWLLLFLVFVLFGSGMLRGKTVRAQLNDEGTKSNRQAALVYAFWTMMAGTAFYYAYSFYQPMQVREVIPMLVTLGAASASLSFGNLERRALKS
jgi:hypothetical protein